METTQCPQGVTQDELDAILGDRRQEFDRWMRGQTMSVCDGRTYVHDRAHNAMCPHLYGDVYTWECDYTGGGHYEDTVCVDSPHGVVVYRSDLDRFLKGLPIFDW